MVCMSPRKTVVEGMRNSSSSSPSQSPMVASLRQLSCYQALADACFARDAQKRLLETNNPAGQNHAANSQISETLLCSDHGNAAPRTPRYPQATRAWDTPPRLQRQQRTSFTTAAYDGVSNRYPERQLEVFAVDSSVDPNMNASQRGAER
jgi:hypothetical protein